MAYRSGANTPLGYPGIGVTGDSEMKVPIGTIATMYDDVYGGADFIYLPGVNGTVADDLVIYDLIPAGQATTRLTNAAAPNSGRPVAVAKTACVAGQWAWYQISGLAIVNAVAGAAAGALYASATAGSAGSVSSAGSQVLGARLSSPVGTPSAGKAYATLSRPVMQSQIT